MSSGDEREPMEAGIEKGTSHGQQQPQQPQQHQQQQQLQENQGQQQQDEEQPSEASAVLQSSATTSVTTPSSTPSAAHSQMHGAASDQAPIPVTMYHHVLQIGGTTTCTHSLSLPGTPVVTHQISSARRGGGMMVQLPPTTKSPDAATNQSGANLKYPSEAEMEGLLAGVSLGDGRTSSDDDMTDELETQAAVPHNAQGGILYHWARRLFDVLSGLYIMFSEFLLDG